MKRFNAARLTGSVRGSTNQQVHMMDTIGRPLELNLSPPAQEQMLQALLSTPASIPGTPGVAHHLRIRAVRPHTLSTGDYELELIVGPNQSIRISFAADGLESFRAALDSLKGE